MAEPKRLQPLFQKVCRDSAKVTCSFSLFRMREAATGNALSITVDSWELTLQSVKVRSFTSAPIQSVHHSPRFPSIPRLYTGPVCDDSAAGAAYAAVVAPHKWILPIPFTFIQGRRSAVKRRVTGLSPLPLVPFHSPFAPFSALRVCPLKSS